MGMYSGESSDFVYEWLYIFGNFFYIFVFGSVEIELRDIVWLFWYMLEFRVSIVIVMG